jgi:DNA modification methylase
MSEAELYLGGRAILRPGDCFELLKGIPDNTFDSVVTDPPYALVSTLKRFGKVNNRQMPKKTHQYQRLSRGFMGKQWDTGDTAHTVAFWAEVFRVLKPGGFVLAFAGTRTYHRLACAIEDAGFEIRDMIGWLYGSGFPKSHSVSKGIDKIMGADRNVVSQGEAVKRMIPGASQHKYGWEKTDGREYVPTETVAGSVEAAAWEGWGTALKPAQEPICMARKPLSEKTVAKNVLRWGTGAINVDGCRIETEEDITNHARGSEAAISKGIYGDSSAQATHKTEGQSKGRWPANIAHDGSDEVVSAFPQADSARASGNPNNPKHGSKNRHATSYDWNPERESNDYRDTGSAARFFYTSKADSDDRLGSNHPTVKPINLMQWLIRLVTPPGGMVLDPFAGTGTTAEAAIRERMVCVLMEEEEEYQDCIRRRMKLILSGPEERKIESIKAKIRGKTIDPGSLFGGELEVDRFAKSPLSTGVSES